MSRQLGPAGLVVTAALADAAGRSDLAFYALLAAVPVVAAVALAAYGDVVADGTPEASQSLQALLWGVGIVLVVASALVRAPAFDAVAPALGASTLTALLVLLGLQAAVAAARELRAK